MLTRDIHSNGESVKDALYELDNSIRMAKREKDKMLCLIIGYGSRGGSHKINRAILEKLSEYKASGFVKNYIMGNKLDIFDSEYQKFNQRDRIPEDHKRNRNPGMVYIAV